MDFEAKAVVEAISSARAQLKYKEFRENQQLVVKKFAEGRDMLICLPTGSGKSLCYCLLLNFFDFLRNMGLITLPGEVESPGCLCGVNYPTRRGRVSREEGTQSVLVVSPLIALIDRVRPFRKNNNMAYGLLIVGEVIIIVQSLMEILKME